MPERLNLRTRVRVRGALPQTDPQFRPGNEQKVELVGDALQLFPHLQVEILGRHGMKAGGVCGLNNLSCVQDINGFGSTSQDGKTVITEVTPRQLKGCAACPINPNRST